MVREVCSKCRGRAKAGEACCSLSHFGVVLGGWSARVGNKWCAEQSHLHRRGERATVARVGLHGLHTPWDSWDVVAAPLPGLHLLDSTAFWRDGLMHVVCVCAELQAFCIFGLNCLVAGRSDAIECNCRIAVWQAQSCHGYYFCCVAWGKYRVCGVAFVWNCGCYVLSLICQKECQKICQKACQKICQKICQKECQKICQKEYRKICQKEYRKICQIVKRYVRKSVKRYVRKNVKRSVKKNARKNAKRYVRKNVKRYVRKMSERISKDMSERTSSQSAKLRVTERISGDELYVYPHLTRSGWHKI